MKMVMLFAIGVWVTLAAPFVTAAEPADVQAIALPSQAAGWTWDGQSLRYDPRTIFDYIDGAGEMFLAYGFRSLAVRRFEKPDGPPLTLECYDMGSADGAYGVFSFERQEAGVGIGQGSEFGGGLLRFWKGRYFVSIFADGEGSAAESGVLELGRRTAAAIAMTETAPKLVGLIPRENAGLVDTSVRYITSHILLNQRVFIAHENVLGVGPQIGAVLAQYARDAKKAQLLLIRYPTITAAGTAYQRLLATYLADAGGRDRLAKADQGWTVVRHRDTFVIMVLGASTEQMAEALLTETERAVRGA